MSAAGKFLKQIRAYDQAKLRKGIDERHAAIRTLRFDLGFGNASNIADLRRTKRELAQLWTVLGEQQMSRNEAKE